MLLVCGIDWLGIEGFYLYKAVVVFPILLDPFTG